MRIQRRSRQSSAKWRGKALARPSQTPIEAAEWRIESPEDIEAARVPAQTRPMRIGDSSTWVNRKGTIESGSTSGKATTPEKPISRIGTRKIWKVGYMTTVSRRARSLLAA